MDQKRAEAMKDLLDSLCQGMGASNAVVILQYDASDVPGTVSLFHTSGLPMPALADMLSCLAGSIQPREADPLIHAPPARLQ